MRKSFLFITLLFISSTAFAGGSLPFVQSMEELSASFEGIIIFGAVIALIIFALYASMGEGGGMGKLVWIVVVLSLGVGAATVAATLFGDAGAGALIL